jgi:alpha-2-macroglobulin
MSRLLVSLLLLALVGCGDPAPTPTAPQATPAPAAEPELISAHTQGVVSRNGVVRVLFVDPVVDEAQVGQHPEGLFSFEPPLQGATTWTTERDLQFKAATAMAAGQAYRVTVDLGKANAAWAGKTFGFDFAVQPPSFRTELAGLSAEGEAQTYEGTLHTGDVADAAAVETMLVATQGDEPRTVSWTHESDSRTHRFTVAGIARGDAETELLLAFNGTPIGVERTAEERVVVPGDTFGLTSVRAVATGERNIELRFSDPLDPRQQLAGLIEVRGRSDIRFDVDGSVVRVYSRSPWQPNETLLIRSVRDDGGRKLPEELARTVSFEPIKPEVRFSGSGVLVPSTDGLRVPVEVVNLRSVLVEAHRVFSSNVPQFLQTNDWDGGEDLHRVGRPVWRQRVEIEGAEENRNRWVHLGLDLSRLLADDPDGLYRLTLTFDRGDILYSCDVAAPARLDSPERPLVPDWEDIDQRGSSYWDFWDTASGEGMSWWEMERNRENPCHPGYYREYWDHDITASRNVMMTDLGLIAKQGEDGRILAVATDLRTAEPVAGVAVKLLDYQLQTLATATTDEQGMVSLSSELRPFVLEAHNGDDAAYLKLERGGAIATAHFDVSGAAVSEGLKGFLYGERGVWRPGDDIFLTFLLFDEAKSLPTDHPVHFSLRDPRGRIVERRAIARGLDGFYDLTTRTADNAPTGNYVATVQAGGATFSKTLRIETVVPNRLKIEMPVPDKPLTGSRPLLDTTLTSRWLHGAIARNLEASVDVSLKGKRTTFDRWEGYVFDDLTASLEAEEFELFRGRLDEEGTVHVTAPIEVPDGAPGMLTALLRTRVFEPGGNSSIDEVSLTVSPHDRYVGLKVPRGDAARGMLLTDTKHPIELVTVNAEGRAEGDSTLEVKLYEVSWRWWWEKGAETFGDYAGTSEHAAVAEGEVKLVDGRGTWEMEVKYPEWGRYLLVVTDKDGTHRATKLMYIDWPGWAGRGQKENPGGASVLTLSTSDKKVEVGAPVTVNIPTPSGGRALVSIENGSEILRTEWVTPTGDTTPFTFTSTASMAPNVYVHVTLLQPHGETGNDRPIRLVGVVPVEVYDPTTKLQPVVQAPDVFEPESTARVTVNEKQGRAMTYTLAVVDEGLLGLTRHKTPNPWSTFYAKEALGVRSWDLFDIVMGAYGGAIEGLLAIGGDGSADEPPVAKANRFPPMVRQLGPFRLEAGKTASHEVDIPAYLGEVRVMVVAGRDGAYGAAERSVKVKKPLMALATLPRVLSVGEDVHLPISVFATDNTIREATVSVSVSGAAKLVGSGTSTISFSAPGDKMVALAIKAGSEPGVAKVDVVVSGHGHEVRQSVELDVRYPALPVTDVIGGVAAAGEGWTGQLTMVSTAGPSSTMLEVSRIPPMDLDRRLDELIAYPHGCVEQTTSAVFPQVALNGLVEVSPERAARISENIRVAIARLATFQTRSGGFGYWPGEAASNPWSTSYVGHFLVEAERAGHVLPGDIKQKWIAFQKDASNQWVFSDSGSQRQQAYRLYTLARAGEAELGAMNRMSEIELDDAPRWRLAAAYALAGQPEAAAELVATAKTDLSPYSELAGTFGSHRRDAAMVLEALVLLGRDASAEAEKVSDALASTTWLSTQETAYSLLAMSRFAAGDETAWSVEHATTGKWATVESKRPLVQVPVVHGGEIRVKNPGGQKLYTRVVQRGLPVLDEVAAAASGLAVTVKWANETVGELNPQRIDQGTDFTASITVANQQNMDLNEVALSALLPSGWETFGEAAGVGTGYEYRDVRDDRVMTYFDLKKGETKSFTIKLHAAYLGRFFLPPVVAETMYDAEIHGRTAGTWIEVVPAGGDS